MYRLIISHQQDNYGVPQLTFGQNIRGLISISGDESKTSVIEVNCETDFVAKNDDFINFVKELSELNNQNNSNVEDLKTSKMTH